MHNLVQWGYLIHQLSVMALLQCLIHRHVVCCHMWEFQQPKVLSASSKLKDSTSLSASSIFRFLMHSSFELLVWGYTLHCVSLSRSKTPPAELSVLDETWEVSCRGCMQNKEWCYKLSLRRQWFHCLLNGTDSFSRGTGHSHRKSCCFEHWHVNFAPSWLGGGLTFV